MNSGLYLITYITKGNKRISVIADSIILHGNLKGITFYKPYDSKPYHVYFRRVSLCAVMDYPVVYCYSGIIYRDNVLSAPYFNKYMQEV